MQISFIGVLVHPYFAQETRGASRPHEIEVDLRTKRDDQATAILENPSAVLLYFPSSLTEYELTHARRGQLQARGVQSEELEKIGAYEMLLENRFVVLPRIAKENAGQAVKDVFEEKGWEVTSDVRLVVSGEMYDVCATRWANEIARSLEISPQKLYVDPELSMTQERIVAIYERH